MAQKLTLSAADLSRELGMPESDIGEILPASQQAIFSDRVSLDRLRSDINGQPTDADKRLAFRHALDAKVFSVEAAVQNASGTERGMLGVTAEARRDAQRLGAAVGAGATALANGDPRGALRAISHPAGQAGTTQAAAPAAGSAAPATTPSAAPASSPVAAWEKVSQWPAQLATHLDMSYREIIDALGMDAAQRAVFVDQTAYEALRAEMTGKSIIEKRTILRKAYEDKKFSIQAANSPAPAKAAEAKADLLAAADAAKHGDLKWAAKMAAETVEDVTGMPHSPIDMQEVAKGYKEGGAVGAMFGLMGSLFHSIFGKLLGSLSALAGLFGGGKAWDKVETADAEPEKPEQKPAAAPEKPFMPMKEENFAQYAKRVADDLEKKIGVKLDAAKRKKLEEEILPRYRTEIGDVSAEVLAKQEINLAMVFKTPVMMIGFMSDLVSNDIVDPSVIAMNYLEDGSNLMMLGLRAAGSALGAGSVFGIEFGAFSADSIAQAISTKMHGANAEEQKVLAQIFCHQGGIVASLLGGLGAGLGRMLLGFSALQRGLPSEMRMGAAAFFGRQQTLADELGKIATALEPSGVAPAYVVDLQNAVKSTAAQIQFTDLWHDTVTTGTPEELRSLSKKVDTLRMDPMYRSSQYLDAVQARINTLAANGLPPEMKGLDDLARDIAKTGMQHTPKATVVHFQERMANSVLRNFADAQVNGRLLMNELATVSQGLDARLSVSNGVERAFKDMAAAMRVERLPGQARDTIYAINHEKVADWNRSAKIVALQAPDLFRSFMRGAGVIAITGLSAATADAQHSFLGNLATNMAWTVRFGPLAFALCDLEKYKLDLKNGNFTGMAELALITAQTAMDVTAGAKFAAKTLIRGQWNMGTLGQFGRFMAPVAFDAVELGSAGIRTGLAARDLLSGAGRATAVEAAAAETGLISRMGSASRSAVSAVARATSGAAADTLAVLRGAAPFSAMRAVGFASTVLTAVLMANEAYAYVDGKLDEKKLADTMERLKADKVIDADGNIDYEKAGYMIRTASPEKFPPDVKKRFCELVVFGMLDASLKVDPNNPKEVADNRKYEVNVNASDLHRRDQDVTYMSLYGVPFQVKHSGEKVTVTFMNGPVHPHEQQRIVYAFNAMGMDAEVKMDVNAQNRYKNMWSEYLDQKHFFDNNWLAEQAAARGIKPLSDGKPDRAKFIESCRQEYMILTGITDPKSTDIPPELRQTV